MEIINIISSIMYTVGLWGVFGKAGIPGWHALIPYFRDWELGKIARGKKGAAMMLMFRLVYVFYECYGVFHETMSPTAKIVKLAISSVCLIFVCCCYHKLAKAFEKDWKFTVGLVLLEPVFLMILAFDLSMYEKPYIEETSDRNSYEETTAEKGMQWNTYYELF